MPTLNFNYHVFFFIASDVNLSFRICQMGSFKEKFQNVNRFKEKILNLITTQVLSGYGKITPPERSVSVLIFSQRYHSQEATEQIQLDAEDANFRLVKFSKLQNEKKSTDPLVLRFLFPGRNSACSNTQGFHNHGIPKIGTDQDLSKAAGRALENAQ